MNKGTQESSKAKKLVRTGFSGAEIIVRYFHWIYENIATFHDDFSAAMSNKMYLKRNI